MYLVCSVQCVVYSAQCFGAVYTYSVHCTSFCVQCDEIVQFAFCVCIGQVAVSGVQ